MSARWLRCVAALEATTMSMKKVVLAGAALSVLAAIASVTQPAGAQDVANWTFTGCEGGKVTSGAKCNLKNQKNGQCLVHSHHMGQVDWDFGGCNGQEVTLISKTGGQIKCGETVALKVGNEFFRKCVSPQTVGINICSDGFSSPQEKINGTSATDWDWKITGCPDGQPVEMDKPIVLHNISRNDSVVYAKRPSKMVDTCWANSMKFDQCVSVRDK
jgi:hypothetical protein